MSNDQCLFGYSDGHRLLASSVRLSDEVMSLLTVVSDLAPGTSFAQVEGYWTGIPVPALGRYALMHTWPAPEMPRPGCVWTHVLLLDTEVFESVNDLSTLQTHFRRPRTVKNAAGYSVSLDVDVSPSTFSAEPLEISTERIAAVLDVVYGSKKGPVEIESPGELDGLIFTLWSQQWPKLRRNFRFRTAASRQPDASPVRFDLTCRMSGLPVRTRDPGTRPWIRVSTWDLQGSGGDHLQGFPLRHFLRRYGADVKRPRSSFMPLCEVFASDRFGADGLMGNVASDIVTAFPDRGDAAVLKADLVDGNILSRHQLETLRYLEDTDKGANLPYPSSAGMMRLTSLWPKNAAQIMVFADHCVVNRSALARSLVGVVSDNISVELFWNIGTMSDEMRRELVRARPGLLDSDSLPLATRSTLKDLIEAVSEDDHIGAVIVERLRSCTDPEIASNVVSRFPTSALPRAMALIDEVGVNGAWTWIRGMVKHPSLLLQPSIMAQVKRTSILHAIGEGFDWDVAFVAGFGLRPWLASDTAQQDLGIEEGDTLSAFLLALALVAGEKESETVFEREFSRIHDRLMKSKLSRKARSILMRWFPSAGWWRDWDDALRLRLAVVEAYQNAGLSTESFAKLPRGKKQRAMLEAAAEETYGAARYVQALNGAWA